MTTCLTLDTEGQTRLHLPLCVSIPCAHNLWNVVVLSRPITAMLDCDSQSPEDNAEGSKLFPKLEFQSTVTLLWGMN